MIIRFLKIDNSTVTNLLLVNLLKPLALSLDLFVHLRVAMSTQYTAFSARTWLTGG